MRKTLTGLMFIMERDFGPVSLISSWSVTNFETVNRDDEGVKVWETGRDRSNNTALDLRLSPHK
jgi:hypothetical protein